MSERSHERLEELIAADALGGLDAADREAMVREMAEHGPDCPECIRLVSEYTEVAGRLALSLDPVALSRAADERLLVAARAEPPAGLTAPSAEPAGPIDLTERRRRGRRWLGAAAVAAALVLLAGFVGYSIAPRPSTQSEFAAFLASPSTRVVALQGKLGQLAVAFRPGQREAWIVGSNLPAQSNDRVYELWYSAPNSDAVNPSGTFVPQDGTVLQRTTVGSDVDLLAVSIEPPGGSRQPSTTPIFAAPT